MKDFSRSCTLLAGLLLATALTTLNAAPAHALDTFFSGPRALGMGGANIASVNSTHAQYYNPAAFGFMGEQTEEGEKVSSDNSNLGRKEWGVDLSAGAGIRMHEDFGEYVDTLAAIDYTALSNNGIQNESDLADLVTLLNGLKGLEEPGNAITSTFSGAAALRAGNFAIGSRVNFQAGGRVLSVDNQNLGITNTVDLSTDISGAVTLPPGYSPSLISAADQSTLLAAGLTQDAIDRIDYVATQQGLTAAEMSGLTSALIAIENGTTGGALQDNTTTVALNGFAVLEIPLSYGYAISDHWSVGGNLKVMKGRVYGTEILVFDDGSGDLLANTSDNYHDSTTFGIDLAVMGRYNKVSVGLIGRNLNSPEFDGFTADTLLSNGTTKTVTISDVKIEPQFAAGIAFIPFETVTLEVDYDLTANKTIFQDYSTRNLSAGMEWDAFRFLALRLGAYKNLAESDIGIVYTAGLGFNFWLMRLDIGAAFSKETARYDGDDYPKETQVAAQLSIDF